MRSSFTKYDVTHLKNSFYCLQENEKYFWWEYKYGYRDEKLKRFPERINKILKKLENCIFQFRCLDGKTGWKSTREVEAILKQAIKR